MVKKLSTLALAAMLAMPAAASAGGSVNDLASQIERLTQELNKLKQEMTELKEDTEETVDEIEEKSELWDLASRIQLSGDFRARVDMVDADTPEHYTAMDVGQGVAEVLDAGANFGTLLSDFGMSPATSLANMMAGLQANAPTPDAFIAGATNDGNGDGTTVSTAQATTLAAIFYNPEVFGTLLQMSADPTATAGSLAPYFSNTENLVGFMKNFSPATRAAIFSSMGYNPQAAANYENDTLWTNRFRLNMRVKATEYLEFKGRLSMYKAWGMQNNPVDYTANAGMGGGPFMLSSMAFDGSSTRQPEDAVLRVDRAFMNWNNIGGHPVWFSIGRRPTTDGPPSQFRLGADKRMATPVNYMDYPFDGISVGYAYNNLFGVQDLPGRFRFCYGRGFESGPTEDGDGVKDVDFAGIDWDVFNTPERFLNFQSFAAFDIFNVPDGIDFVNPIEFGTWLLDPSAFDPTDPNQNLKLDRKNLGNIYHTSTLYQAKYNNLDYFFVGGWSRTDPRGVDELGTSLLGSFYDEPDAKDGYSFYAGLRYDIEDMPFKVGLEYNYGTKNWIAFTPGHDDLYQSKLATRGHVWEVYTIWDIPAGELLSKFSKAFVRLGYQHYEYDYTGSGFWLGEPLDIDEINEDPLSAQFYTPIEDMDQIYLTLEAWF